MPSRDSRRPVLGVLLAAAGLASFALVWFGVRGIEQERAVERQQERERLENSADAAAVGIRGVLAEAGERLSNWVSRPGSALSETPGGATVGIEQGRIEIVPRGALPFIPRAAENTAPQEEIRRVESVEFGGSQADWVEAEYRKLAASPDRRLRAEALLRLGRVLRKSRRFEDALQSYRVLAGMSGEFAGGLPADLAGLDGERLTRAAKGEQQESARAAREIARIIDEGRWPLSKGAAEFYRDLAPEVPRSRAWVLAEALAQTVATGPSQSGQRLSRVAGSPVIAVWRTNGARTAVMVCFAEPLVRERVPAGYSFDLLEPDDREVGNEAGAAPTALRMLGEGQNRWMLRLRVKQGSTGRSRLGVRLLGAMLAIVLLLLWSAVYFIARALKREAEAARLQSDFVARVSHEFRSPLTTVRQLAEMLEMDQVPSEERRRKYYSVLSSESRRLQKLVETILSFGKMEAGAQQYRMERLGVEALVERVVGEFSTREVDQRRIVAQGEGKEATVRGDADALAMALRNLVDNALKYSAADRPVRVSWKREPGRVAISVKDEGEGIEADEQAKVFERFMRGRSALEANIPGTGVGLAMVRHIVEAHGGEIRLESTPGAGSTFTMTLTEAE